MLLHGGVLTLDRTFGPVIPALAKNHRIIGIELQGHGHTADSKRAQMLGLIPGAQLAVLPATRHTEIIRRADQVLAIVIPFLDASLQAGPG